MAWIRRSTYAYLQQRVRMNGVLSGRDAPRPRRRWLGCTSWTTLLDRGASRDALPHSISVVIPVYQGERTLGPLLAEIAPLIEGIRSPGRSRCGLCRRSCWSTTTGRTGRHRSCGTFPSVSVRSRRLAQPQLRPARCDPRGDGLLRLRLDRHHGRGRSARSGGHPGDGRRRARRAGDIVYGEPTNTPPHGFVRNRRVANGQDLAARSHRPPRSDRLPQLPPRSR